MGGRQNQERSETDLGPEWTVLEQLALGGDEDPAFLLDLAQRQGFSWGELIDQALRHKMAPLVAERFTRPDLAACSPPFVRRHFESMLDVNRHILRFMRSETARVLAALGSRGVRVVGTKGITFESTIYEGRGGRFMNDVDFMTLPEHYGAIEEAFVELGYQHGRFDWQTGVVRPFGRREVIGYQLNPDHILPCARLVDDPIVRAVHLDFASSLTWSRSPYEVPIHEALAEIATQPLPGHPGVFLPCFTPAYQFLFTVLHFFRESWFAKWIEHGQDANLIKLADVVRLFEAHRGDLLAPAFADLVRRTQTTDPLLWVLTHTDRTLGTHLVSSLGIDGEPSEAFLQGAVGPDGEPRRWRGSMRARLQAKDRSSLFELTEDA